MVRHRFKNRWLTGLAPRSCPFHPRSADYFAIFSSRTNMLAQARSINSGVI
jgi:hypothetical protein